MPQLNPSPWFLVMLLTWTILMFIMLNKTLNLKYLNTPMQKESEMLTPAPWTWPWI
uniref:ATP synthase complex subunit 8 n=1 Tax=Gambelia wislizenii TaxID=43593 RepID=A0A0G3F0M1_GAMWI|nr:ATP synthase F0 subunit 8 [Gambelia wislizenii]